MGADKAFLSWGDGTLLDHALTLARSLTERVHIVGDRQKFAAYHSNIVEDNYRDRGPLGGIHAALTHSTTELNLMLAVDMPMLSTVLLAYVIAQARESNATVTVPRADKGFQPLCAVYRREFAAVAEQSLRVGKNKIDPLFSKVETRIIEEEDLLAVGFSAGMFRNVNTPDDLEQARLSGSGPRNQL